MCAYFVVVKKWLKINLEKKCTLQNPIIFASHRKMTVNFFFLNGKKKLCLAITFESLDQNFSKSGI
jgi:hypothetical protein